MSIPAVVRLDPNALGDLGLALAAADLPTTDLKEPGRIFFRVGENGAFGGLEGDGPDRLLRSIVVPADRQRSGLGSLVVRALEAEAIAMGVRRLHLLTTGAAPFFRKLGYQDCARAWAPNVISGTEQFRSLCPASAAYLVKDLEPPDAAS